MAADYAGPSGPREVYALARVGLNRLPVPLNGNGNPALLVADTFRLAPVRARTDQQILRRITVVRQETNGPTTRSEVQYAYEIANGILTYIECPVGSFCVATANLVYAPRIFQIAGDSLFEVTPVGANLPPYVYGLVRYR